MQCRLYSGRSTASGPEADSGKNAGNRQSARPAKLFTWVVAKDIMPVAKVIGTSRIFRFDILLVSIPTSRQDKLYVK